MKKILLAILLFSVTYTYGQTVGEFRYDTTKFWKNGGFNEVKIQNNTKGITGGVFTNIGNGWGKWLKLDSLITGTTDTTVFSITLDSTGQPQSRVLFGGANNHITSDANFLYSSSLKKLLIGGANISVGGPSTKLYVNGNVQSTGDWLVGGQANISGAVTAQGITTSTDTTTYKPWGISAGGVTRRLTYWPGSGGGGGNPNSNIGSGYRWAVPNTNNIKTFFPGYGLLADSSTNANAITAKVDTTLLDARYVTTVVALPYTFTGLRDNDLIKYDSTNDVWRNFRITFNAPLAWNYSTGTASADTSTALTGLATKAFVLANAGGSSGWGTTGNSGLTYPTNYLGTNDATGLGFATNSTIRANITSAGDFFIKGMYVGKGASTQNYASVAIGDSVLGRNTSGKQNVGIGDSVLYVNTTGVSNTAVGFRALEKNTTGNYNTGIGEYALNSNTTGETNTAVGEGALISNSTSSDNTAIGFNTLYTNTTGLGKNTALGREALRLNTSGNNNTAAGYVSMYSNTSGAYNTAYGISSLQSNQTGGFNTAVGHQALFHATGSENVAIGLAAGYGMTSGTGNLFLGYQNVATGITTGSNNVIIGGYYTGLTSSLSNNIIIGTNGTKRIWGDANGNIAIGSTTPDASAKLDVQSTTSGMLMPRMTATQASAISSPANGLMVYVTDTDATFTAVGFWGRVAGTWTKMHL